MLQGTIEHHIISYQVLPIFAQDARLKLPYSGIAAAHCDTLACGTWTCEEKSLSMLRLRQRGTHWASDLVTSANGRRRSRARAWKASPPLAPSEHASSRASARSRLARYRSAWSSSNPRRSEEHTSELQS